MIKVAKVKIVLFAKERNSSLNW